MVLIVAILPGCCVGVEGATAVDPADVVVVACLGLQDGIVVLDGRLLRRLGGRHHLGNGRLGREGGREGGR